MKIKQISRRVSGSNYSNIELVADLTAADDIDECILKLDEKCHNALDKIEKQREEKEQKLNNKYDMLQKIDALKEAIENNRVDELPF